MSNSIPQVFSGICGNFQRLYCHEGKDGRRCTIGILSKPEESHTKYMGFGGGGSELVVTVQQLAI